MTETPKRLQAAIASLEQLSADALLVTDETNVRYLSGFTGDSSALLITPAQTIVLSDGRFETQIKIDCPGLASAIRPPTQQLHDLAGSLISDLKISRVAIEAGNLTLATYRSLQASCEAIDLIETNGVVERLRTIKDAGEIELTRAAVRVAESALESVLGSLAPDMTERAIAYEIEAQMRALGASGCSFPPIVASGSAGALPHYDPGSAKIGDHNTLLIDWGAIYQGYASDLTRTFHRDSVSAQFRNAYEAVLQAQLAAIETIAPGIPASAVDAVARSVLEAAGLAEAFVHSLGHGIGLAIHEGPRVSPSSDETLVSGMIITIEPGVYFADNFGIRIEDDVLVTDSGHEVLSQLPKGLDDCRLML